DYVVGVLLRDCLAAINRGSLPLAAVALPPHHAPGSSAASCGMRQRHSLSTLPCESFNYAGKSSIFSIGSRSPLSLSTRQRSNNSLHEFRKSPVQSWRSKRLSIPISSEGLY